MHQQIIRNRPALLLEQTNRTFQVDCVPEDDLEGGKIAT